MADAERIGRVRVDGTLAGAHVGVTDDPTERRFESRGEHQQVVRRRRACFARPGLQLTPTAET